MHRAREECRSAADKMMCKSEHWERAKKEKVECASGECWSVCTSSVHEQFAHAQSMSRLLAIAADRE